MANTGNGNPNIMAGTVIDAMSLPPTPITNPVTGSLYFNTNTFQIMVYYKGQWAPLEPLKDLLGDLFDDIVWEIL